MPYLTERSARATTVLTVRRPGSLAPSRRSAHAAYWRGEGRFVFGSTAHGDGARNRPVILPLGPHRRP
ncbi:MAG: hypothetical protein WCF99_12545 [Chloroflexales bacterium]